MLMLTMDIGKEGAYLAQGLDRHGLAVDKAARGLIRIDHSAQNAMVFVVNHIHGGQPFPSIRQITDIKTCLNFAALGTAAHDIARSPIPEQHGQGINQD